jgi:DHA1 family bicyclomycin/chloramphenicol resistance-like MFS transporter
MAPLTVDMFLPSLPTMSDEFAASESALQLAVTLFIIAFAGSQLVYGPASDRIGRRPALLAGLTLFVAGSLLALSAQSVEVLLAGRVVQGLGGGAGPAVAQAIVLDVYGRQRAARVLSYMAIALPLAPAIAPIFGGFLHEAFGWHSVFITLATLGVLLAVAYGVWMPETRPQRAPGTGGLGGLVRDYRTVFSSRTYLAYAAVMGLMFGGQLVFISSSSFVLQDEFGLSAQWYGLSFGLVAMGIMLGATISSRLVVRLPSHRIVFLGTGLSATASALMLVWVVVFDGGGVAAVLAPMFATAVGLGLTRPAAVAGALVPFPQIAGLASALLGFSQMLIASTYNIVYGALVPVGADALAIGVACSVGAAFLAVLILRPRPIEA